MKAKVEIFFAIYLKFFIAPAASIDYLSVRINNYSRILIISHIFLSIFSCHLYRNYFHLLPSGEASLSALWTAPSSTSQSFRFGIRLQRNHPSFLKELVKGFLQLSLFHPSRILPTIQTYESKFLYWMNFGLFLDIPLQPYLLQVPNVISFNSHVLAFTNPLILSIAYKL